MHRRRPSPRPRGRGVDPQSARPARRWTLTTTTPGTAAGHDDASAPVEPEAPPAPLLTLRDGLPQIVDTPAALARYCAELAAGTGPVAIDAERASGYRYSQRAYLIQLRREGSGTALVDPIAFESLTPLADALAGTHWILHAATQDLPCLAEVGLHPASLFDTELAGRLLGFPRVGLATLVEELLGCRMRKEHSAVDWSTRPLPLPWLEYAALDVEVLLELREVMVDLLDTAGKTAWAEQEFEFVLGFEPNVRVEPWRRTSGAHRLRGRRASGAVRALWETRDRIAQESDVSPSRLIPDSAIVAAAQAMPCDLRALLSTPGFHGRGARRYSTQWLAALDEVRRMPEQDLPGRAPRVEGPPQPRAWADKDPVAARRLALARVAVTDLAEREQVPVENLLTPDHLRRLLWTPPATRDPARLADEVTDQLQEYGARPWQVDLIRDVLVEAILAGDDPAAVPPEALSPSETPSPTASRSPGD